MKTKTEVVKEKRKKKRKEKKRKENCIKFYFFFIKFFHEVGPRIVRLQPPRVLSLCL